MRQTTCTLLLCWQEKNLIQKKKNLEDVNTYKLNYTSFVEDIKQEWP